MEHQQCTTLGLWRYCNFVLGVPNSIFQYDFDQSYNPVSAWNSGNQSSVMQSNSHFDFDFDFDPCIVFHSFFYFNILTDSKSNTLEHSAGQFSCASVCKYVNQSSRSVLSLLTNHRFGQLYNSRLNLQ